MENLNQLVEVINQMKDAKKNGANADLRKETFYTIALLKEIFGQEMNPGVLREMMKDVRNYLFDPEITISTGERSEEHKLGINLEGNSKKGILVAHVDEKGQLYRGDVKLLKKTKHEWRPDDSTYYEFIDGVCVKNTPGQTTQMTFEENGIEVARQITKYDNVAKTPADIISTMSIERDTATFNVVHVNIKEKKAEERSYDGQMPNQLYSLITAATGRAFGMTDDVSDLVYESIEDEQAYRIFPELKEAVTAKLQRTSKSK